jgi:CheY-like chemotaxis protein
VPAQACQNPAPAGGTARDALAEQSSLPTVLLLGDWERSEFAAAVSWLQTHTQLTTASALGTVAGLGVDASAVWDHVVIAQSRPGQVTQADVDRLGCHVPLAQFTALLGSACEGEPRSGRPWPGVTRVYWHQWRGRAPGLFAAAGGGRVSRLPRTVSEPERLDHALRMVPPRVAVRLAIDCPRATDYDGLAAACRIAGYQVEWAARSTWPSARDVVATLWHRPWMDECGWAALEQSTRRMTPVPVVALFGFPRQDQVQRARACGVAAVLSVPFLLPDLWNILHEVTA